jgi:hypothetical protein
MALVFSAVTSLAHAEANSCTRDKSEKAEYEYTRIHTWVALHKSYLAYHDCDDGGVAEGYDDAMVRLFLKNWNEISSVKRFILNDKKFAAFIIHHVNEEWSRGELENAKSLASKHCPKGLDQFCRNVVTKTVQSESG